MRRPLSQSPKDSWFRHAFLDASERKVFLSFALRFFMRFLSKSEAMSQSFCLVQSMASHAEKERKGDVSLNSRHFHIFCITIVGSCKCVSYWICGLREKRATARVLLAATEKWLSELFHPQNSLSMSFFRKFGKFVSKRLQDFWKKKKNCFYFLPFPISLSVSFAPAKARPLRFRLTRLLRAGGADDAKPRWTLPEAGGKAFWAYISYY